MNTVNPSMSDTLLVSLIGFITVFAVLIVLMFIIQAISKLASEKKTEVSAPAAAAPAAAQEPETDTYTGVKLIGVEDKDAALIMAIVANDLDKPLENLRFISIKEVK